MSPKPTMAMRPNGPPSRCPALSLTDGWVRSFCIPPVSLVRFSHCSRGPTPARARSAAARSRSGRRRFPFSNFYIYTPHPRRATGSRQMLRPIAGAMMRSSAISRSNCAGNSDCAPSLNA